jgi:hypothetical protein
MFCPKADTDDARFRPLAGLAFIPINQQGCAPKSFRMSHFAAHETIVPCPCRELVAEHETNHRDIAAQLRALRPW